MNAVPHTKPRAALKQLHLIQTKHNNPAVPHTKPRAALKRADSHVSACSEAELHHLQSRVRH